ncbi:iron-sulfur cluster assembly 2 [Columba livia]|uniref:Iron-sulfur cluster assembly 2 n=1 Tax=Columba livia TaxID=8932 RepID=A0A2I0MP65_COLLI|nr:iron-sulfur cluster assembly 2 [Columba livia]
MWDFILCQILTGLPMDGHCLQTLPGNLQKVFACSFSICSLSSPLPCNTAVKSDSGSRQTHVQLISKPCWLFLQKHEVAMSTHIGASSAPCKPPARWC